jgi:hypothetical protein
MSPDKVGEIVYLHYKDSCETLSKLVETRMRLFPILFAVMGLILFQTFYPAVAAKLLTGWISDWGHAGATDRDSIENVVPKLARSLLWFTMTVLVAEISGASISIEHRAAYLRDLEKKICSQLGGQFVVREGHRKPDYHRRTQIMNFGIFLLMIAIVSLCGLGAELYTAWKKLPLFAVTAERVFAAADLVVVMVLAYCGYEFVKWMSAEMRAPHRRPKSSTS